MTLRIAEVADITGVPATTIRYYEDEGLLRPPQRQPNGYRSYSDRDVERLRFVSRARHLDLSGDDLRDLVEVWEEDDCARVADHMRDRVAHRLGAARERFAELVALAEDLQQVLRRLDDAPHAGACVPDECVCLDRTPLPEGVAAPPAEGAEAIACSLEGDAMPQRIREWHDVLRRATARTPIPGGVSVRLPVDPQLAADLVAVAAAEQDCCNFFGFDIRVTADALHLEVTAPEEAAPIVAAVFGTAGDDVISESTASQLPQFERIPTHE